VTLTDFDYTLPDELIAQEPAPVRDRSRLMVLDPDVDSCEHRNFGDLPGFLRPNDLLVLNDTRVFPARLIGRKEATGGEVELFLLCERDDGTWDALTRPARRVRVGTRIIFGDGVLRAGILEKTGRGQVRVRLESDRPVDEAIDTVGRTPLPPYIRREPNETDRHRYQTVYSEERGSVAAPTAGLHFSGELLDALRGKGIDTATITLHVGIGTFRPLGEEDMRKETLHGEFSVVPESTVRRIEACRMAGGRVVAVGTTTTRALETAASGGGIAPYRGWTNLFIKPPYAFRAVDALVTNFHLPRSSLLMLVCAFAGSERVLAAYREAVRLRYRFYSYGDAMLILGRG